jgi:hypothetical protein
MLPRIRIVLSCTVLLGTRPLAAQRPSVFDSIPTPRGMCGVWVGIPGGSNPSDLSYARCALDRPPALLSDPALPQPLIDRQMGGQFTVIVNADGRVDPRLTRAWNLGMDSVAYRRTLEALRAWRFRPGTRANRPVRSGFILHVATGARVDTLPSHLSWAYRTLPFGEDSLTGTWSVDPTPVPPLTLQQRDSTYAAVFRRLLQTRVITPGLEQSYCLVTDDAAARDEWQRTIDLHVSRTANRFLYDLTLPGGDGSCERTPGTIRLFVTRLYRTEQDRIVLYAAGDYLADWPPGFGGRTYAAWSSRCVARVPAGAPAWVNCDISPRYDPSDFRRTLSRSQPPRWYHDGDSIRVTVVAMTRGAFQSDTLRTVVHRLGRLSQSAVMDDQGSACAWTWSAFTGQRDGELYVVKGALGEREDFYVTEVRHDTAPALPPGARCMRKRQDDATLALFILGDIGDPIRSPVRFCTGQPLCSHQYELDPARHTLAKRAHLRFRVADLRPESRTGNQLVFRITVDPVPEGLIPLVLIRSARWAGPSIWPARRIGLDTWEYGVTYDPEYPSDAEAAIYLVAR